MRGRRRARWGAGRAWEGGGAGSITSGSHRGAWDRGDRSGSARNGRRGEGRAGTGQRDAVAVHARSGVARREQRQRRIWCGGSGRGRGGPRGPRAAAISSGSVTVRTNPHGAVATGTDGGVDGKDAGEQGGPGDPRWRALGRRRGGQRGQLGIAVDDEQRQLVGLGGRLGVERLELGLHERPETMAAGEDAVVRKIRRPVTSPRLWMPPTALGRREGLFSCLFVRRELCRCGRRAWPPDR